VTFCKRPKERKTSSSERLKITKFAKGPFLTVAVKSHTKTQRKAKLNLKSEAKIIIENKKTTMEQARNYVVY
jgi:hypothetical protein